MFSVHSNATANARQYFHSFSNQIIMSFILHVVDLCNIHFKILLLFLTIIECWHIKDISSSVSVI